MDQVIVTIAKIKCDDQSRSLHSILPELYTSLSYYHANNPDSLKDKLFGLNCCPRTQVIIQQYHYSAEEFMKLYGKKKRGRPKGWRKSK